MPPRHGGSPGAIPGSRTNSLGTRIRLLLLRLPQIHLTSRAPACAAESPKLSLPGAAPGRLANFLLGAWQKSDAPALQAGTSGSVTRRPPPFHCGENQIQASLINSASVGATPTPATIFGK
jgi:hypothetical protein